MLRRDYAWMTLVAMAATIGALVFAAAGTFLFWRGWVFVAVFFGASGLLTWNLAIRQPALLERRLKGGPWAEMRPVQRIVMTFVSLAFVAVLVVPPYAWRKDWLPTSAVVSAIGDILIVLGYIAIGFVFRENAFAAATIQIGEGQQVISTGPYAWVRHPMYAASVIYLVGIPLALGSWWGLVATFLMLPFLLWRLVDEERMLTRNLAGYEEYMGRVRSRLIPSLF